MRFAHVSDLHLCHGPDADTGLSAHAFSVAEAMARDLARIREALDFVVVSGDLTDDAHPASFAAFERLFRPVGLPVVTIPGNHDGPAAYVQEASRAFLANCDITGRAVEMGEILVLGLNTCLENKTIGAISQEDTDLVANKLAMPGAKRAVVVMHHPPFPPGLRDFDEIAELLGAPEFATQLASASNPPVILSGHVHRAYQARYNGVTCFVAGSPAMPFTSDLPFGNSPIRPSIEECRYFVHSLNADGRHVVTSQPFSCDGKTT